MSGIIPTIVNGGVTVRDGGGNCLTPANVSNAYCPDASFTSSCDINYLPNDCTARITAAQINAFQSEVLCLAETLNPGGNWNCGSLCNLSAAFQVWEAENIDNTVVYYNNVADVIVAASTDFYPVGTIIKTHEEQYSYVVVASNGDISGSVLELDVFPEDGRVYQAQLGSASSVANVITVANTYSAEAVLDNTSQTISADVDIDTNTRLLGVPNQTVVTMTGGDRGFNLLGDIQRSIEYSRATTQTVALLQETNTSLSFVDFVTPSEVASLGFTVGSKVTVSFGTVSNDADDRLWVFSRAFRIKHINGGRVFLDEFVPPLKTGILFPGSPADQAVDWANSFSYTAGDYVLANDNGTANTGQNAIYRADANGVSNGTGVFDDTGVSWTKVRNRQDGLVGTRDGRPVIQLYNDAEMTSDVTIGGFEYISAPTVGVDTMMFQLRSSLDVLLHDMELSGDARTAVASDEHSNRVKLERVNINLTGSAGDFKRALAVYNGKMVFDECVMQAGPDNNAMFFMESYGEIEGRNSTLSPSQPPGLGNSGGWLANINPGVLRLYNCRFGPFDVPFRNNTPGLDPDNEPLYSRLVLEGCQGEMAAFGFRAVGDQSSKEWTSAWPGNDWIIYGTAIPNIERLSLAKAKIVPYQKTIANLAPNLTNNARGITNEDMFYSSRGRMGPGIILGYRAIWDSPSTNANDISVRVMITDGGSNTRRPMDTSGTFDTMTITEADAGQIVEKYSFRGAFNATSGRRAFGPRERLFWEITTGSTAGGDLHLWALVLTAESYWLD